VGASRYLAHMPETDEFEFPTERWCAGLRVTRARSLSANEREAVAAWATVLRRQFWLWIACAPVGVVAPVTIATFLPGSYPWPWLQQFVTAVLVADMLIAPALCLLRARELWRRSRGFARDLARGEVLHCEGALDPEAAPDPERSRLIAAGILSPDPCALQAIDVLPESAAVLSTAAGMPAGFPSLRIAVVAAGPSYAFRIPLPESMAWLEGDPQAQILRRTLNPSEQAELETHIQRLRRPSLGVLVWTLYVTGWIVAASLDARATLAYARARWPLVAVQVVMLGLVVGFYTRGLKLAARLEQDTRTGWALTLDRSRAAVPADVPETAASATEFLPHSRALWIERGRPARWRNLRRAA